MEKKVIISGPAIMMGKPVIAGTRITVEDETTDQILLTTDSRKVCQDFEVFTMKITNLRIRELEGIMEYPGIFWEERLRMPTDIYPEYRDMGPELMAKHPIPLGDDKYRVVLQFLQIETDEGLTGLSGPLFYPSTAFLIDTTIKRHLIGKDPLRTELHWDVMYRSNMNARADEATAAVSMVDIRKRNTIQLN